MKYEDDGKPVVGAFPHHLGVVAVPTPDRKADITPIDGVCQPNTGGMSVAPSISALPHTLIPKRHKALFPGASGSNQRKVFRMGDGSFSPSGIGPDLRLEPDSRTHGNIEPARAMPLEAFQAALATTRDSWTIGEPQ